MKEFFLSGILAADELDIIDHQHINRTEAFLELHRVLMPDGLYEMMHEGLGGHIDHPAMGEIFPDMGGDGMHQVCLAQPDPAIEKQRVELRVLAHGCFKGNGMGKFVRLLDNEIVKRHARVEATAKILKIIHGAGAHR